MVLGFRRDVDIVEALEGARPGQPEANGEQHQKQSNYNRQSQLMRGSRVKRSAIDDADAGAQDHQRHAGAADHCQAVLRQLACLSCAVATFFCHSKTAFIMIDWTFAVNCAGQRKIRQD